MGIKSGELARLSGVSPDTLRHYERVGVLPKPGRSQNNYRAYPESALPRVLLVRRSLAFGFSLAELAIVLKDRERGAPPCRKVRALAAQKLAATEVRLLELTTLRDELRALIDTWDEKLKNTPAGGPARLLESLSAFTESTNPKETPHEPRRPDPHRLAHPLAGHWSQRKASPRGDESPGRRTPARGQQER